MILSFARAEAAKRAPGLQHPQLCLDAIQHGVEHGGHAGLVKVQGRGGQGGWSTGDMRAWSRCRGGGEGGVEHGGHGGHGGLVKVQGRGAEHGG